MLEGMFCLSVPEDAGRILFGLSVPENAGKHIFLSVFTLFCLFVPEDAGGNVLSVELCFLFFLCTCQ
jgi:hypothetical protein